MIVGIDLGTCNSSLACHLDGSTVLIPNDRGQRLTPSMVAFLPDGRIMVGEGASNQALLYPDAMVREFKRHMGSSSVYRTPQGQVTPRKAAATLLSRMRAWASGFCMEDVKDAVIAVPAHFDDSARRATMEAAKDAGWNVRRLLNEPTAAALKYMESMEDGAVVMVYDFGGGTFDASLVRREGQRLRVLACSGEEHLGGKDMDRMLAGHVWKSFSGQDALPGDGALSWKIMRAAESCKIDLSQDPMATMALPDMGGGPRDTAFPMERRDFEALVTPLVQRSLQLCRDLAARAPGGAGGISGILLSGGTSRIPLIQESLVREFPGCRLVGMNPDEAVALGAAWYGHMLEEGKAWMLEEVASWDLGLLVEDKDFHPLLHRESRLPAYVSQTFTTMDPAQSEATITILQRDRGIRNLGGIDMRDLKPGADGQPSIGITFHLDESEILRVEARDLHGTARALKVMKPQAGETGGDESLRSHLRELAGTEGLPAGLSEALRELADVPRVPGDDWDRSVAALMEEVRERGI